MSARDAHIASDRPHNPGVSRAQIAIDAVRRYARYVVTSALAGLALGVLAWAATHRHPTASATVFVDAIARPGAEVSDAAARSALAREAALFESLADASTPQTLQIALDQERRLLRVTIDGPAPERSLQELLDAYVAARGRTAGAEVSVVRAPQIEKRSTCPIITWAAIGGLAGLLAGVFGAAIAASRDRTIRSADALADAAGVATVLTTPSLSSEHLFILRPSDVRAGERDVASFEAAIHAMAGTDYIGARPFRQSVLRLLARQRARMKPGRPHVVMLAAPTRGTGNTTLAIALAEAGTIAGERILLIDATVSDPASRDGDGSHAAAQITEAALDRDGLQTLIERDDPASFAMLPLAGRRLIGPDLARRRKLAATLNTIIQDFDLVFIDAGGIAEDEAAASLSGLADQIWIVARYAVTRAPDVAAMEHLLVAVRDRIAGAVLTMSPDCEPHHPALHCPGSGPAPPIAL